MTDETLVLTDPARELAELCLALQISSGTRGESFLADKFEVKAWSREFYQIIFTIIERCSLLQDIVSGLDIDDDYKDDIIGHVSEIMDAFSADAMKHAWSQYGSTKVSAINTGPIKAISSLVRQKIAYRKLSDGELTDIDVEIDVLLIWLEKHQLSDQYFIRQALLDGLKHFRFRLNKLGWVGWGYTLDSLREVIAAYMLLERSGADPQSNPDAAAVLQKVGSVIRTVYSKVSATKSAAETGDWLIRAYGAGSLIYQSGKPLIAGLLPTA